MFGAPRSNVRCIPGRRSRVIQRGHPGILFVNLPLAFPFALFALPLPLSLVTTRRKDRRDADHRALARPRRVEVDNFRR